VSRSTAQPIAQILVFAEPLQREGLTRWLQRDGSAYRLIDDASALAGGPQLVLWSAAIPPAAERLDHELRLLQDRWQPAPVLLLLPAGHPYPANLLLGLSCQGLLVEPDAAELAEAVATLLAGGRVVQIGAAPGPRVGAAPSGPLGLGQWLLYSGLQQIEAELRVCRRLLDPLPEALLPLLLLQGRERELLAARRLLLWLWGPLSLAWPASLASGDAAAPGDAAASDGPSRGSADADPPAGGSRPALALTLRQRSADGIWEAVRERLQTAAAAPANHCGQLLALDGLHPERRRDLLLALLEQFDQLRRRLQQEPLQLDNLLERWQTLQPELRQRALRQMAGSYVQLPLEGTLRPVADSLLQASQLAQEDGDQPDPRSMLVTLVQARPLLVEGRLLAADEPQAVLYLELLLANWLVRNAELISAEVLEACSGWPELRRYLLRPELLATRNLERLRNQLNAQQRWIAWFERPVQLYESRRALYRLGAEGIDCVQLTEPRDQELRRLGWPQQLVTLTLEVRDALAPQVQSLVRNLGDLVVVLLTRVVGRAIGLVGRGIAQGMGRSFGRG
jgi:hypothetical protein